MIGTRAVCFDAFGTLVATRVVTGALRLFLKRIGGDARASIESLMTGRATLASLAEAAGLPADHETVLAAAAGIAEEAQSVEILTGMAERWALVQRMGHKVAVCSNLGEAFVEPLLRALPGEPDAVILSCRAGLAKPDPRIYGLVASELGMQPSEILFVGDTPAADYDGPRAFGMKAMSVATFRELLDVGACPPTNEF